MSFPPAPATRMQAAPGQRTASARLAALVPDLRDVLVLAGIAALVTGAWKIYEPAGWIVLGLTLLGLGLFGVPRWES